MILAGIDIGTNTLRLLVAETGLGVFHELHSGRIITRLGQDLDRTGLISEAAGERSISALVDFKKNILHYSTVQTSVVGTSALRRASNSVQFAAAVKQRTGFDLTVISGEEEARLTLLGVAQALNVPGAPEQNDPLESAMVIDIGGGSTEIIMTRQGASPVVVSLPLGAVYLTERFIKSDPPSSTEEELIKRAVRHELDNCSDVLQLEIVSAFIGTAGTVTTLAAIDLGLATYDPIKINSHRMTRNVVDRLISELGRRTLRERRKMPGLEHGREDIVFAGAVILQEIMERFSRGNVLVSNGGLREGIVLDLHQRIMKAYAAAVPYDGTKP